LYFEHFVIQRIRTGPNSRVEKARGSLKFYTNARFRKSVQNAVYATARSTERFCRCQ